MKAIPKHIIECYGSTRKYKEEKRRHLRVALAAVIKLNEGAAYMPGIDTLRMLVELRASIEACSVRKWGK